MTYEVYSFTPTMTKRVAETEHLNQAATIAANENAVNAKRAYYDGRWRCNEILAVYQDGRRLLTYSTGPKPGEEKGISTLCNHQWPFC